MVELIKPHKHSAMLVPGQVSYLVLHTGQASSFGGCMALVSYLDTARRPVSFLAKKPRFVTTSNP